jgi:hypothetical protein
VNLREAMEGASIPGERCIDDMLAAQDHPTIPVPGNWRAEESVPMTGDTPEDRLRMQDHLTEDYE